MASRTYAHAHAHASTRKPVSYALQAFIKRCLTYRKEDRPDVLAICQDPYLQLIPQPKQAKP